MGTGQKNGLHWAKLQLIGDEKAQFTSLDSGVSSAMFIYVKIGTVLVFFTGES